MATLNDNALTTLDRAKSELQISNTTHDDYLIHQINDYSSLFVEATGRPWHRDDSYTEKVPSTGDPRLHLERRPVRSITEIKVEGDTIDADEYAIEDADAGIVRRKDEAWESTGVARRRVEGYTKYHEDRVEVTYDGGYVTPKQVDDNSFTGRDLPPEIERAVITTVATKFRRRGQPSGVESESIGSASISYNTDTDTVFGQSVAASFASAVKRHKDRSVLR